jgi:photosystem II PsbM protein
LLKPKSASKKISASSGKPNLKKEDDVLRHLVFGFFNFFVRLINFELRILAVIKIFKTKSSNSKFMETNFLGLLATVLAIFVPTVFLLTLYIQTSSREEGQSSK